MPSSGALKTRCLVVRATELGCSFLQVVDHTDRRNVSSCVELACISPVSAKIGLQEHADCCWYRRKQQRARVEQRRRSTRPTPADMRAGCIEHLSGGRCAKKIELACRGTASSSASCERRFLSQHGQLGISVRPRRVMQGASGWLPATSGGHSFPASVAKPQRRRWASLPLLKPLARRQQFVGQAELQGGWRCRCCSTTAPRPRGCPRSTEPEMASRVAGR